MTELLITATLALTCCLLLLWLLSVWLRDVSIVDIFWGFGFVVVAWLGYWRGGGASARSLLLCVLVTLWGVRLAGHLWLRNHGKGEDYRYQAMRKRVGAGFWWQSAFIVFGLQGALMLIISLPLFVALTAAVPAQLSWLDGLGSFVWLIGFVFESVGDWQLTQFRANPQNKGKVLNTGLWRYTRHPNYFGDALLWWGLWIIALATPSGWWTIIGPVVMTILLMRVSGVALLEKSLSQTKPQYADYVRRTNAFIPWWPKP